MQAQEIEAANVLAAFSDQLARAVERAGAAVVRVDGRARQSASGMVWDAGGLILTANHVVERDADVKVHFGDGVVASGNVIGRDPGTDVALLRLPSGGLTPMERARGPRPGQTALIVARPNGDLTVSSGVVSSVDGPTMSSGGAFTQGVVHTDAAFYPGFSGAPFVDAEGRMLGMATSHFGGGLVIPTSVLEAVAQALLDHGRVQRGFLGLHSQQVILPATLTKGTGITQNSALLVVGLEAGGPAEQAGLFVGDIVLSLDGQPVRAADELLARLGPDQVGKVTEARFFRGGEVRDVDVTIGRHA